MKDQFVTYEIAEKLQELGFNEKCLANYGKLSRELLPIYQESSTPFMGEKNSEIMMRYSAPLWQQAIDWLREKDGTSVLVYPSLTGDGRKVYWFELYGHTVTLLKSGTFESFEKARETAILKALELIEK